MPIISEHLINIYKNNIQIPKHFKSIFPHTERLEISQHIIQNFNESFD